MGKSATDTCKASKNNLLLTVLLLNFFLACTVTVFSSTLLVDIAASFNVSVGLASQLALVSSVTGLVIGIFMGALAVRFNQKALFLSGVVSFAVGALGFFLSGDFVSVLISQIFIGIGVVVIGIMTYTLIGEHLPVEKRGWAVGLTASIPTAAYIIVGPLSGIISGVADWRSVLLWFILPFSVVCLTLSSTAIPNYIPQQITKPSYFRPFREILLNRSAMACVFATVLLTFVSLVPFYAVSFYRLHFGLSSTTAALFSSVAAVGGLAGGLIGGRLVNRIGRKPLTVAASAVSGVSVVLFSCVNILYLSAAFWVVAAASSTMAVTALFSLVLEQVPSFRASMVSINSAFNNAGYIVGVLLGGLVLTLLHNNFQLLMILYGCIGAVAAPVVLFFATDPSIKETPTT
jgi:predicted MFS family arabinose efflux permease